jgi:hypothetical protein
MWFEQEHGPLSGPHMRLRKAVRGTVAYSDAPNSVAAVGPVSNTNGTLSATDTVVVGGNLPWACQRALTARNNVVIDVKACSHNTTDQGVSIAGQIAAKVPT